MRLLKRFCLNLLNIEYFYKAEEANITRNNITDIDNAINKLNKLFRYSKKEREFLDLMKKTKNY